MKLLFTILLILPSIVYTQKIDFNLIEYQLYKVNKSKVSYTESGISDKFDTINYEFRFTKDEAFFGPSIRVSNEQSTQINLSDILIETFGSYYYDFTKKEVYNLKELQGKLFSIVNNFNNLKWEIFPEITLLNGYKCKKAIFIKKENSSDGKSNDYYVTVWFSEDIESKIAPFGLTGLPGGIVKVDFNNFVEVIIGKYRQERKVKIKPNKLGQIVIEKEFEQIQNQYFENQKKHRNLGVDRS